MHDPFRPTLDEVLWAGRSQEPDQEPDLDDCPGLDVQEDLARWPALVCCHCGRNPVEPGNGLDTCAECVARTHAKMNQDTAGQADDPDAA